MEAKSSMVNSFSRRRRPAVLLGLIVLLCGTMVLSACGGGGSGPVAATAEDVQTGTPLQAGDWQIELLKAPEKIKVVGKGNITYQAEGDFLVVFAKVTNQGQAMQLVSRDLFLVHDGQGNEFEPVKSAVQVAYVLQHGMEPSLDSPLAAGQARDSVIIFDVPADATALTFGLSGTEATLKLGF